MKITIKKIMELDIWKEVAEVNGYDYYAVNEGLSDETEIEITINQLRNILGYEDIDFNTSMEAS